MMNADLHLRMGDDEVRMLRNGAGGPAIRYDDREGWLALRNQIGKRRRVAVTVAEEVLFVLSLPTMPREERELRRLLNRHAPLRPRDLVWTQPFLSADPGSEMPAMVALVRRQWLAERIATVAARLEPMSIEVTDGLSHPFGFRKRASSYRSIAVVSAFAIGVAASLAMWLSPTMQGTYPGQAGDVSSPPPVQAGGLPTRKPPGSIGPAINPPQASVTGKSADVADDRMALVGIVGRLPDDARVLVRMPWGRTVTMQKGDTLLGWRIVDVAPNRIVLDRAGQRRELEIEPAPQEARRTTGI